jgi:hypothetical protein
MDLAAGVEAAPSPGSGEVKPGFGSLGYLAAAASDSVDDPPAGRVAFRGGKPEPAVGVLIVEGDANSRRPEIPRSLTNLIVDRSVVNGLPMLNEATGRVDGVVARGAR